MRSNNPIKITMEIPFPISEHDRNGIIYTKEAVENAVNNLHKHIPIIFRGESEEKVIGTTIDDSHIATWNFENQVCNLTVNGEVFFGGAEGIVTANNGKIVDFEILGIGLSK